MSKRRWWRDVDLSNMPRPFLDYDAEGGGFISAGIRAPGCDAVVEVGVEFDRAPRWLVRLSRRWERPHEQAA